MHKNIFCIGRNYLDHVAELKNDKPSSPVVFLKTPSSLRGLEKAPMAFSNEAYHHEAEIVLVVGKSFSLGAKPQWKDIKKVGLGLDLTRREAQQQLKTKGLPWTIAKSFTGATVLGTLWPREKFDSIEEIKFSLEVNGELRQSGNSKDMIFPIEEQLQYLASFNSLEEGDLVFTGTPSGVGPIKQGDKFVLRFLDLKDSKDEGVL